MGHHVTHILTLTQTDLAPTAFLAFFVVLGVCGQKSHVSPQFNCGKTVGKVFSREVSPLPGVRADHIHPPHTMSLELKDSWCRTSWPQFLHLLNSIAGL